MSNDRRIEFVGLLRALAVLLVVYAHVVVNSAKAHNVDLSVVIFVKKYITEPFSVIQNFGWFGVVLFFLISGYIIAHTATKERAFTFFVKRVFRIYPAFLMAIIVAAVIRYFFYGKEFYSATQYFLASTLFGVWPDGQVGVLGVEWTLIIEIKFYFLCFLLFRLFSRPVLLVSLQLFLVSLFVVFCRSFDASFFLFSVAVSYVPFLICGELMYFYFSRKMSVLPFVLLTLTTIFLIIFSLSIIQPRFLKMDSSYLVSFAYAYFIFYFCALHSGKIKGNRFTEFFEKISYSLYLYHGVVAFLIIKLLLSAGYSYGLSLFFGVISMLFVSWVSYKFIELPFVSLARSILKK